MRKRKVITLILLGVFLAGLALLLYPSVSNYWNSITQSKAIVDYDTIVKSLSPKDYTGYFERAEEYNRELKALPFPLMEYQQISGYDDCLNAAGDGVIGYIDIDKIQVKLPIYHGTDPSTLFVKKMELFSSSDVQRHSILINREKDEIHSCGTEPSEKLYCCVPH